MSRLLSLFALLVSMSIGHAAFAASASNTMQFSLDGNGGNCNGCEWIEADGPITGSTPDDFEKFLKKWGDLDGTSTTVMLNSRGGNLIAGLKFGESIRRHKLPTSVGTTIPEPGTAFQKMDKGVCYSACSYAFLGGLVRWANQGDLGFHQFALPTSLKQAVDATDLSKEESVDQQLMGFLVIYLKEMEIDPQVLMLAASANPDALYIPTNEEMTKLGITNDGASFSGWSVEPYHAGALVTGTVKRSWVEDQTVTFFCKAANRSTVYLVGSYVYSAPMAKTAAQTTQDLRNSIEGTTLSAGSNILRHQDGIGGLTNAYVSNDGRYHFIYPVTEQELLEGVRAGSLILSIVTPEYENNPIFTIPTNELGPYLIIALKACVA